ncbi:MAG: RNA polymerase-binding protein DksA [Deltaproteobacteria bacterium]|nr:RNA polymerase-binding protein DksA [Deltaproteobacteria bacterium]
MNKRKKELYRKVLKDRLEELVNRAGSEVGRMSKSAKEHLPDPNDRASLESERNFLLRIRDRERKLILKIQEALERIDQDQFGICEVCGEPIEEKRLKARPVTTMCFECKSEAEAREKRSARAARHPS